MIIANIVSYILVLLGAVNWGLYGIFDFNLVSAIFMGDRSVGAIITYIIIALAAIWLIIGCAAPFASVKKLSPFFHRKFTRHMLTNRPFGHII